MLSMGSAFTPNYQYGIVIIFSMFVLVPLLNFSQPVLNSLSELSPLRAAVLIRGCSVGSRSSAAKARPFP